MGRQHLYQHEPVTPPSDWNNEERGMVHRIEHLFDDVYQKLGKVRAQIAGLKGEELPDFDQFATKEELEKKADVTALPTVPTDVSAFNNDVPYMVREDLIDYEVVAVTFSVTKDGLESRTIRDERIKSGMAVLNTTIPNMVQGNTWTVTSSDGYFTLDGTINKQGEVTFYFGLSDTSTTVIAYNPSMYYRSGDLLQFRTVGIAISSTQIVVMWQTPFRMNNVSITSASASATGIGTLGKVTLDTSRTNNFAIGFNIAHTGLTTNRAYLVLVSAYLTFD